MRVNSKGLLIVLIILYLFQSAWVCSQFLFPITDSDQTIQWLALKNYSDAIFHEPYYYGQNYNLMTEAWLGIPFHRIGLSLQTALVLVTKLIWIVPVLALTLALFKRQMTITAFILIGLNIAMPLEWHILTGIPRGFIQGISVGIIGLIAGLHFLDHKRKIFLWLSIMLMVSGILLNPNTLILLVPVGLWIWMNLKFNLKEWIIIGSAVIPPISLFWLAGQFYENHPEYVLHTTWKLRFSPEYLLENLKAIIYLFKGLFPWFYEAGIGMVGILVFLSIWAWKRSEFRNRWLLAGMWLAFGATLFLNKVSDGSGSIFFPYARMYIGLFFWYLVPVMILERNTPPATKVKTFKWVFAVTLFSAILFFAIYTPRAQRIMKTGKGTVDVIRVDELIKDCQQIERLLNLHQKELMVILGKSDAHNYGCAAISDGVQTFHPDYERRTWVYQKYIQFPVADCLFLDRDQMINKAIINHQLKAILISEHPYSVYRIDESQMNLLQLYTKNKWRILGKR